MKVLACALMLAGSVSATAQTDLPSNLAAITGLNQSARVTVPAVQSLLAEPGIKGGLKAVLIDWYLQGAIDAIGERMVLRAYLHRDRPNAAEIFEHYRKCDEFVTHGTVAFALVPALRSPLIRASAVDAVTVSEFVLRELSVACEQVHPVSPAERAQGSKGASMATVSNLLRSEDVFEQAKAWWYLQGMLEVLEDAVYERRKVRYEMSKPGSVYDGKAAKACKHTWFTAPNRQPVDLPGHQIIADLAARLAKETADDRRSAVSFISRSVWDMACADGMPELPALGFHTQ